MAMAKKCDLCGSLYECYTKSELKNGGSLMALNLYGWMQMELHTAGTI